MTIVPSARFKIEFPSRIWLSLAGSITERVREIKFSFTSPIKPTIKAPKTREERYEVSVTDFSIWLFDAL